ncbi:VOC family protein [Rhodococcus fascians]|nr:VOC family protein [Rhodococcus fascians]MBY4433098.1 VOC family protein [Rhodococcus fascians]
MRGSKPPSEPTRLDSVVNPTDAAGELGVPARVLAVTFDCPDPRALARFYTRAVGLPVTKDSDDFVLIGELDGTGLAFYRLAGYQRPTWPEPGVEKQIHLELGVEDLDTAQKRLVALGASVPDGQPDGPSRRVLIDPAGHPFCITQTTE